MRLLFHIAQNLRGQIPLPTGTPAGVSMPLGRRRDFLSTVPVRGHRGWAPTWVPIAELV